MLTPVADDPFVLRLTGWSAEEARWHESLFSLGNGNLVVRSAIPWAQKEGMQYPGTYAAALYNTLESRIAGETVRNDSIVNLPNGLWMPLRVAGEAVGCDDIAEFVQTLDLRCGVLRREAVLRNSAGRTRIIEERFVSMDDPDLVALRLDVEPLDWEGVVEIAPGIDGTVINANIEKHADHAKRHLNVTEMWQDEDRLILQAETTTSGVNIRVIARDRLEGGMPGPMMIAGDRMSRPVTARLGRGQRLRIDRTLTICTGDGERPPQVPDHDRLREAHADAWQRVWQRMPLSVQGEDHPLSMVRFHLLQNWSPLSLGRDAGFPARGWQEAYRGQIFWDGMFATFVYAWRFPDLAREALMYRHRRLGAARSKAQERGLRGALYPWRSARSGDEATPRFQKFMTSGHWHVDHTHLQAHINSAIAHDIFQYGWISGDRDFLHGEGLEMLVEIARLWDSLAMHDPVEDRFDIAGIIGPDEFHTHAPGRETPGLKNNAYTNLTAVWTLIHLIALLEEVPPARRAALGVTGKEVAAWDRLSRRMRIAFRPDGLISQFEGVEALRPLDPAPFGSANVQWELEAQGADVNDHAIFKQADMGMLLYLFTPAEVVSLLARLGYVVPEADLFRALTFYRDRSSHNSSLSEVGYAAGLARFDPALSWKIWRTSVRADLDAEHAGGTGDGLHLGAGAASIDVLQRVFMGLRADADGLQIAPAQPDGLGPASFGFRFQGNDYTLEWDGRHQHLSANADNTGPLSFRYHARTLSVQPGERVRLE